MINFEVDDKNDLIYLLVNGILSSARGISIGTSDNDIIEINFDNDYLRLEPFRVLNEILATSSIIREKEQIKINFIIQEESVDSLRFLDKVYLRKGSQYGKLIETINYDIGEIYFNRKLFSFIKSNKIISRVITVVSKETERQKDRNKKMLEIMSGINFNKV